MDLKEYKKMAIERSKKAAEEGFSEYKKQLEGPWGGSKLPNGIPVGRISGHLRKSASLVTGLLEFSIINRANYWPFIKNGTHSIPARGKAIVEKIIQRVRERY